MNRRQFLTRAGQVLGALAGLVVWPWGNSEPRKLKADDVKLAQQELRRDQREFSYICTGCRQQYDSAPVQVSFNPPRGWVFGGWYCPACIRAGNAAADNGQSDMFPAKLRLSSGDALRLKDFDVSSS